MNPAMWISKTGVQAQDAKLQAIANNLANVNTVGFKRDRVVFEDLFYQVDAQPGAQNADNTVSNGVQLGNGVRVVGTQKAFTNGSLQQTSQPLDVAISGAGFLQVRQLGPQAGDRDRVAHAFEGDGDLADKGVGGAVQAGQHAGAAHDIVGKQFAQQGGLAGARWAVDGKDAALLQSRACAMDGELLHQTHRIAGVFQPVAAVHVGRVQHRRQRLASGRAV